MDKRYTEPKVLRPYSIRNRYLAPYLRKKEINTLGPSILYIYLYIKGFLNR
jgi:hypothetical protein